MSKPDSIKSIRQKDRTRDKMQELYALWQRKFPDGIGVGKTIVIKDEVIGWIKPLAKVTYEEFLKLIVEFEKKYKIMEKTKK